MSKILSSFQIVNILSSKDRGKQDDFNKSYLQMKMIYYYHALVLLVCFLECVITTIMFWFGFVWFGECVILFLGVNICP